YPAETVDALWALVWRGLVTNDTFHALRAFTRAHAPRRRNKASRRPGPDVASFRSRRLAPASAEGRWALVPAEGARRHQPSEGGAARSLRGSKPVSAGARAVHASGTTTKWAAAMTQQLLARHGVLTREAIAAEAIPGGFGVVYPVLKGLEDTGRIRR